MSSKTKHQRTIRIHPSILSANYMNLEQDLQEIKKADAVHVDVMDNHFVPNLTIGLPVVEQLQRTSPIPLDIHLMIDNPDLWAIEYARCGAASVTFHAEAAKAPIRLAQELRKNGTKAAMALNPMTSVEPYFPILKELDLLLIMTVEPGFGGQNFLDLTIPKLQAACDFIQRNNLDLELQVDGGINEKTIQTAAQAGANNFVAGSAVFNARNPEMAIENLRQAGSSLV